MARIEPFRGLRPRPDLAAKVASPPYDVLNSAEARAMADGNPHSFLHVVKPEIDLPVGTDLYADEVYAKARENLRRMREDNVLIQDDEPCFYLYRQLWKGHEQVGLVAGASARDYLDDVIRKHELTREQKETDRMRHIQTLNANTGPVFLTFKQRADVDALFARGLQTEPVYDFTTADGVRHVFYVIRDPEWIRQVQAAFRSMETLYVADGHHRSAAATRVKVARESANPDHSGDEEYNFFLAVIFPHNQMKILPYNRVVRDLNGLSVPAFLERVEKAFEISEQGDPDPRQVHEFSMYLNGNWYRLTARPESFDSADPVASLDVSILQTRLLAPVLGIENPRTDERIDFVGGIRGTGELMKLVDGGEFAVAFSLYPTTIEQLFRVADAGLIMPPKSTWFEPKLRSGMVIHLLD
ncbi:MAG: DUF1015 family protein [Acidobacteriota bacterium]|jgi:uncharacterized protein (DUF1015 family)|nr:DUF1015 family protein [Acidobacteriota bacterium]